MRLLLDTNAYSALRRGHQAVAEHVLAVTWETADIFGRISTNLRKQGTPIPSNDIWIAAHSMEAGADLLSSDPHFRHIEGLSRLDFAPG